MSTATKTRESTMNPKRNYESKKVMVIMDIFHKWYLEEFAHQKRITQNEALHIMLSDYCAAHPIAKKGD